MDVHGGSRAAVQMPLPWPAPGAFGSCRCKQSFQLYWPSFHWILAILALAPNLCSFPSKEQAGSISCYLVCGAIAPNVGLLEPAHARPSMIHDGRIWPVNSLSLKKLLPHELPDQGFNLRAHGHQARLSTQTNIGLIRRHCQ